MLAAALVAFLSGVLLAWLGERAPSVGLWAPPRRPPPAPRVLANAPAPGAPAPAAPQLLVPPEPGFSDPSGTCTEYRGFVPFFRTALRFWRRGSLTSANVSSLVYTMWAPYTSLGKQRNPYATKEEEDYYEFYHTMTARVQLVGGRLFFARRGGGFSYSNRSQDVARQLAAVVPWAAERGIALPDVDLAYNIIDFPVFSTAAPAPAPPHAMAGSPGELDVPIPDMSFLRWPRENGLGEEQRMDYAQLIAAVLAAGDHAARPYAGRVRRALFRASIPHDFLERVAVAAVAARHPDVLDVGTWANTTAMSLADASTYAVLLAIPGNGWMARLKYALAAGSPVVVLVNSHDTARWTEWWYPRLRPFVHYWPIRTVSELLPAVRHLLDHPDQAAAIGAAGREFVAAHLRPDDVRCYWAYYLTYLSGLFAPGGVARHPATVPLPDGLTAEEFEELYNQPWPSGDVLTNASAAAAATRASSPTPSD